MLKTISDLQNGEIINSESPLRALVFSIYQGKTRKDKPFVNISLRDKTGTVDLMLWDTFKDSLDIVEGSIIEITTGTVSIYNNTLQVNNTLWNIVTDDIFNYLPAISENKLEQLRVELDEFILQTKAPFNDLLNELFNNNEKLFNQFIQSPAAVYHHGDCLGGLFDHTISVTKTALALLQPEHDKSLVIAAALLHDIGKVKMYTATPTFKVTLPGTMLDHIVLGLQFVPKVINKLRKENKITFSEEAEMLLLHCIAAHQGKKEYGTPVEPRIPEAFILSLADSAVAWNESYQRDVEYLDPGETSYSNSRKTFIYKKQLTAADELRQLEEQVGEF